jgi:hypothetical protein
MTDPSESPEAGVVTPQDAYVSLLIRSGHFGDATPPSLPGLGPVPTADALRALTDAPKDEIPSSVRIAVLYDLARQGFPNRESAQEEYRRLAQSVGGRDVEPDQLLKDLDDASSREVPFHTTSSGQALGPEVVAFVGESVCTVQTVKVGDLTGTWIYSEFDTDAPFESVTEWVDPRSWPDLAPFMFKRMDVVGAHRPLAIAEQGTDHWHGVFHEEVQLFDRISALLHCDHWKDEDRAAGMTFELAFSPDGQLNVDRGYIAVTNTGLEKGEQGCRVQALKIVGFTEDKWDELAQFVCPFWTDFLRGAVRGAASPPKPTEPSSPTSPPGSPGPEDLVEAWTAFFGTSARSYLDLFEEINARAVSGRYSPSDWLADGSRFWSRLAKDWVQAWTYGLDRLPEVARDAGGSGFVPPPPPSPPSSPSPSSPSPHARAGLRGLSTAVPGRLDDLVIAVPGLGADDRPVASDLKAIEARPATIAAREVSVTVVDLPDGTRGVRLRTSDTSAPPGLYVGTLLRSEGGPPLVPVQLYVSGALTP